MSVSPAETAQNSTKRYFNGISHLSFHCLVISNGKYGTPHGGYHGIGWLSLFIYNM